MNGSSKEDIDKMRSFFKETSGTSNDGPSIDAIDFSEWTAAMDSLGSEDLKALFARALFLFDQPTASDRRGFPKLDF